MELQSILDEKMVPRTLKSTVLNTAATFPVILVTGPRQVGKTTLLRMCADPNINYVTLDDMALRQIAKEDPALFIQTHKTPLIIDEVQYAPELFPYIKLAVDNSKLKGQYWLTGSQQFHLMKNITESLAGRVGILKLLGLSLAEAEGKGEKADPFIPNADLLNKKKNTNRLDTLSLFEKIWRGSLPEVVLNPKMDPDIFFSSYVQTYIQRDVRDLTQVADEATFLKFMRSIAARTGQLLNMADLARDVDIDPKTAKSWLSILQTSGLVLLLEPYYTNLSKRMIKSPKLYFLDTGLCCHLTRWTSAETLLNGAMSGAVFETFIITETVKSYIHNGKTADFYFYRDKDQKEIDLLIEQNGKLYPVEIKKTAIPNKSHIKHFSVLKSLKLKTGIGALICLTETPLALTSDVYAFPVSVLV